LSKKKKNNKPRRWNYKRGTRLQTGPDWIKEYTGKHILSSYCKYYKVSQICGAIELRMLGVDIPESKIEELKKDENLRSIKKAILKKKKKEKKDLESYSIPDSDETFSYIVGYISGGFPYGTTWEEEKLYG
jgi:hypothetical protein